MQVEITPEVFSDTISAMEELQRKLANSIEHTVGLRVKLHLVPQQTIERSMGKAKRVIDRRQLAE